MIDFSNLIQFEWSSSNQILYNNCISIYRKMISFILKHNSHPLACMLRQVQQKVLNKLSKLHMNQTSFNKNEISILEEHFKNIAQGTYIEYISSLYKCRINTEIKW